MGTLASELQPIAAASSVAPRVYVDANIPAGAVDAMRRGLSWDVFFVLEHAELRRARDREHFTRALTLGRTLITCDHDFCDSVRFPPDLNPGVIVCSAPDLRSLLRILKHVDDTLLRPSPMRPLPLRGRTVEVTSSDVGQ